MQPNKDFRFRDDLVKSHKDTVPIELLNDPFTGIIYRYTTVAIKEEEKGARLIYAYEFLELNGFDEEKLRKNGVFEASVGNILNGMILETIDSEQQSETRTGNSEEPTEKRDLLS